MDVTINGRGRLGTIGPTVIDGQFDAKRQGALSLTPRIGTEWGHGCDDQLARPIGDNRPYRH